MGEGNAVFGEPVIGKDAGIYSGEDLLKARMRLACAQTRLVEAQVFHEEAKTKLLELQARRMELELEMDLVARG